MKKNILFFLIIISVIFILLISQTNNKNFFSYSCNMKVVDVNEVEEFYSGNRNVSSKMNKVIKNSDNYIPVKCDFTVINNGEEQNIIKKAIIKSEKYELIYDNNDYNICESPIEMETGCQYEFSIYVFIKYSEELSKLSEEKLLEELNSEISISVV